MSSDAKLQLAIAQPDPPESPFYIPATVSATRPRRALKHGDTFLVVDSHGDIGASAGGSDGLYHDDTRFLSLLELRLNGAQPLLLGSNVRDDNTLLAVDLTNPDIYAGDQIVLQKDIVHVARTIFLWKGTAYQRIKVRNHGLKPDRGLALAALRQRLRRPVRGARRAARAARHDLASRDRRQAAGAAELQGAGRCVAAHDARPSIRSRPSSTEHSAVYRFVLAPHEARPIFLLASCREAIGDPPAPFLRGLLGAHRELRRETQDIATVETSNGHFNEVLCRAAADLGMLMTETPQGRYPYAGIPWYSTTFGRDGLITAIEMLWCDPGMARGVLRRLAAFQAKDSDPAADAEPGKILHEMRAGEMAALREVPFGLYYGSVDSTPLFVLLAGLYAERTGDDETLHGTVARDRGRASHGSTGRAIPMATASSSITARPSKGLANQGWKDSYDAIFHADGRMAEGPIALAEVQGYVFAAKETAARCALRLGDNALARKAPRAGDAPQGEFRRRVLVPGDRHVRARARRREAAVRGAHLECRADIVHRHRARRPRARDRAASCSVRASFPAGASAPSRAAKRATIRCRITTARSGRTTTR